MLEVIDEVVVKVRIEAEIKIGIQLLLGLGGWVENWRVMLISKEESGQNKNLSHISIQKIF